MHKNLVSDVKTNSSSIYSLTVGRSSDLSFDYVYGFGVDGNYGSLNPTSFEGTNINYLVSRTNQRQENNAKFQQKCNLDSPINAPNGIRITRLDTNESVVLPGLDGTSTARFHLANSTNPMIKRSDVGHTIQLRIQKVFN